MSNMVMEGRMGMADTVVPDLRSPRRGRQMVQGGSERGREGSASKVGSVVRAHIQQHTQQHLRWFQMEKSCLFFQEEGRKREKGGRPKQSNFPAQSTNRIHSRQIFCKNLSKLDENVSHSPDRMKHSEVCWDLMRASLCEWCPPTSPLIFNLLRKKNITTRYWLELGSNATFSLVRFCWKGYIMLEIRKRFSFMTVIVERKVGFISHLTVQKSSYIT